MSASTSSDAGQAYNDAVASLVTFWGEMASQWGINRTMAQIHARLFCADAPMNTDEIMEALDISRGNANMNLRSLTEWRLVSKQHLPGSRKDYYEADTDVWRITARIIEERQRRELQPVQAQLEDCRAQLPETETPAATARTDMLRERLDALIDLMEAFEAVSEVLLPLVQESNTDTLGQLVQMAQLVANATDTAPRSAAANPPPTRDAPASSSPSNGTAAPSPDAA
ncbi:GbsR/MarR family transcriptional regulator [Longimonas halophila]|uniref:GbsR/MarR family transcriptional regulator n=1 Tax=Longimonas halophila TaxID=1469170 RepID=UPI001596C9AC|nr:hypothetical protein [Longimonas halophila]